MNKALVVLHLTARCELLPEHEAVIWMPFGPGRPTEAELLGPATGLVASGLFLLGVFLKDDTGFALNYLSSDDFRQDWGENNGCFLQETDAFSFSYS